MFRDDAGDEISEKIIGCALRVHRAFGPGLLESVYKACLTIELRRTDLLIETHRRVPLVYDGVEVKRALLS